MHPVAFVFRFSVNFDIKGFEPYFNTNVQGEVRKYHDFSIFRLTP